MLTGRKLRPYLSFRPINAGAVTGLCRRRRGRRGARRRGWWLRRRAWRVRAASRPSPTAGPVRPAAVRSAPLMLEGDLAPGEPVVEPVGAGGAGEDELDRVVSAGERDALRRARGPRLGERRRLATGRAAGPQRRGQDRLGAVGLRRTTGGAAIRRLTSRARAKDSPPSRGSTSPQPASSSSPRTARLFLGQLAQLRRAALRRDRRQVGRLQQLARLRLDPEAEAGRVAGRRGSRGSGRRRRSRRGSPAGRPPRGRPGRRRGRSARAVRPSGTAIALTVKSRRARSVRIGAPRSTVGSAPGRE